MPPRKAPPDALDPRSRLILEATKLFGERGFDAVSTREICAAAEVNPGAIHYHFGDKTGLYREVLRAPIEFMTEQLAGFDDPSLSLPQALTRFLSPFLAPDEACGSRLYLREMLDPSVVFTETVTRDIGPLHAAFARLLCRHIGVNEPDAAIYQLAYGLQAMAHDYSMSRSFMDAITPGLLADDPDLSRLCQRLVDWACALIAFERERRRS